MAPPFLTVVVCTTTPCVPPLCVPQGIVEVTSDEAKPDGTTTEYVSSGQVVGRAALFDLVPEPRTESAVAATKCLLLQLRRADLCKVLLDDRELMLDYELSVMGLSSKLAHVLCHGEARAAFVASCGSGAGDLLLAIAAFMDTLWRYSLEVVVEDRPVTMSQGAKRGGGLSFFKKKEAQAGVLTLPSPQVWGTAPG